MSLSAIRPRPDQVAELTRGLTLPLPALAGVHLEVIARSLLRAYGEIGVASPATIAAGSEDEVTALLEGRLNGMIGEDPLWGQLVLCVARGKESLSFDGSHLQKRPDLSIYLSNRYRSFPLVVEAKIIDKGAAKTEALYCENGIRRFVDGEYAWASREALMLAYVRDGSSIGATLTPFLTHAKAATPLSYLVENPPAPVYIGIGDLAQSRHGRGFIYTGSNQPPGPIAVWHLWLS